MPSAKEQTQSAVDSGKAGAKGASDHAAVSGREAVNAVKAATGAAASATGSAAQTAQDWTNGAKADAEETANHIYSKSQVMADSAIETSKKTSQDVTRFARNSVQDVKQTSKELLNRVVSPERRAQYQDDLQHFAKGSPLAFSFIVCQIIALSIPLSIIAAISTSTFLFAFGSALLSALAVAAGTIIFFFPILSGLFIGATIVWACVISTFLVANWVYYSIYADSKFQSEVHEYSTRAAQWNREIEENAEDEAGRYVSSVKGSLYEGRATLENGPEKVKETANRGRASFENGMHKEKTEARQ